MPVAEPEPAPVFVGVVDVLVEDEDVNEDDEDEDLVVAVERVVWEPALVAKMPPGFSGVLEKPSVSINLH